MASKMKNAKGERLNIYFYNERGIAEQWIKEGKYALKWTGISSPWVLEKSCGNQK